MIFFFGFFALDASFLCCHYFTISFLILQDGILYKLNNICLYKTEKLAIYHNSSLTGSAGFVILNMLGGLPAVPFFSIGGEGL